MARFAIRTLTLNPSIDVSSEAERVEPERKVRTCCERIDPGGGGINVARVLARLGTTVEAIYLAGGPTGRALHDLLDQQSVAQRLVRIADDTRTSLTVHEHATGKEYRFVPEGPTISAAELEACLAAVTESGCDHFVISGSLPPGAPDDFYASAAARARDKGARIVLDTSGPELEAALAEGGIHLLKASKEELDEATAAAIVDDGRAENVALTLGSAGAMLFDRDGRWFVPTLKVEAVSTVGAGDSFLAGMVHGLATGLDPAGALRMAVAAGAAATLSAGTDLAYATDVERLLPLMGMPQRRAA